MNISNMKKEACCGCTACKFLCPMSAISMQEDVQGFLYPSVNDELCSECGVCVDVCKSKTSHSIDAPLKVYAAKSKNVEVQKKASSGGICAELSKNCIKAGGIVYGVVYDDSYNVVTSRIDHVEDCDKLYGSKYVQTDLKNTIAEVIKDLKLGRDVLYFGTSCHISGLLEAIDRKKMNREKLTTVDLICHGVPSPKLFSEYIRFLKRNIDFVGFSFRTKYLKWGRGSKQYGTTIFYNNRRETNTLKSNAYLRLFFSNNCLRPACYRCKHIGLNKVGDFTVADYWGLKDVHPEFFDEYGVSAVFINSERAEKLFSQLKNVAYIESSIELVAKKQYNMHKASVKGKMYEMFWQDYKNKGFEYVLKKICRFEIFCKSKKNNQKIARNRNMVKVHA